MIFCGYCGLQLPSNATRCPRCGTAVDGDVAIDEVYENEPTIAASASSVDNSWYAQQGDFQQAYPPTPEQPQRLILRPEEYGMGYDSQSGVNYPTQEVPHANYGAYSNSNLPPQAGSYSNYAPEQYIAQPGNASQRSKGRAASLVIILLGLLLILAAMVWFAITHLDILHSISTTFAPTVTSSASPTTVDAQQQAQSLVTQYYSYVNSKNYRGAYDLWGDAVKPAPTFDNFVKGYQYTLRNELTITKTVLLNDGSVQVTITIRATEQAKSGSTVMNTYKGYYIVGQQNGMWKILSGQFNKV